MESIAELPQELKLGYLITILVMLLLLLFIILIVVIYNKKQNAYAKEKELQEAEFQNQILQEQLNKQIAIKNERERFSLDLHDELGAGISAMKLRMEFLKKQLQSTELYDDVQELIKTSESLNMSMREMLWSLNNENEGIKELVEFIENYGNQFFGKTDIRFTVFKGQLKEDAIISFLERRNITLCVKEALNNVYKHSTASSVEIHFLQEENMLYLNIIDNGIGISDAAKRGNGLTNMKKRMLQVGGSFSQSSHNGRTLIRLEVPVKSIS